MRTRQLIGQHFVVVDVPILLVRVLNRDRLPEVSERFRVGQVELLRAVVGQDEREGRVLHEIVESPAGQFVELHQVVEICQCAVLK